MSERESVFGFLKRGLPIIALAVGFATLHPERVSAQEVVMGTPQFECRYDPTTHIRIPYMMLRSLKIQEGLRVVVRIDDLDSDVYWEIVNPGSSEPIPLNNSNRHLMRVYRIDTDSNTGSSTYGELLAARALPPLECNENSPISTFDETSFNP